MIKRDGDLRLQTIESARTEHIKPVVIANVCTGAKVNTDEGTQYNWMKNQYEHDMVEHSCGEYVRGETYTNTIEGAFGHFKRCIICVYHKASDKHINRYLSMFAYRWNSRDVTECKRVEKSKIAASRSTVSAAKRSTKQT